jgi:hypothetical protein
MASSISSKHKLKTNAPKDWTHDDDIDLEMYYLVSGKTYVFLYKPRKADRSAAAFAEDFLQQEGIEFLRGEIITDPATGIGEFKETHREVLDIGIRKQGGNALIKVKIIENGTFKGMYWFQDLASAPQIEAIMTKDDRSYYYGDLEYSDDDGVTWSKSASKTCPYIRFKAKKKKRWPAAKHKFSYNVRLPDLSGTEVHLEIDPDIQNPKV